MTYAKRKDATHEPIAQAFRRGGWTVWDTSRLGCGAPDFVAARGKRTVVVEAKTERGRLSPEQEDWLRRWPGEWLICRSVEQAIDFVTIAEVA